MGKWTLTIRGKRVGEGIPHIKVDVVAGHSAIQPIARDHLKNHHASHLHKAQQAGSLAVRRLGT